MVQFVVALFTSNTECKKHFFTWGCMQFNHFAIILSTVVALVTISVSMCFPPPGSEQITGRTIWSSKCDAYGDFKDESIAAPSGKHGPNANSASAIGVVTEQ